MSFYKPDPSLLTPKKDLYKECDLNDLINDWNFSDKFKDDNDTIGSLLTNKLPWQNKWYLRFSPPKSPAELCIDQYWSYESPKLVSLMERSESDSQQLWDNTISKSTKTSLSALKNIALCILSGNAQDTLKNDSYTTGTDKKSADKDGASILSLQMKMPVNESGQTKRSILESFTILGKNTNIKKV